MDNFYELRAEKQEHIINAALTVFARLGYRKASAADIAAEAGIAKGMVFYYFGAKKNLYLYLAEMCGKAMLDEIERQYDNSADDFFDKIRMLTEIKIALMKKHSAMILFLASMYYEQDKEVKPELDELIGESGDIRGKFLYESVDYSKFKDDVDPKLIERFLIWAGEGFAASVPLRDDMDKIDEFVGDFYKCLDLMKKYFYK